GRFSLNVSVPANTEATIILPDGTTHKVGSGKYFFRKRVGRRED
ncbi:MAG: hypothetical protein LBG92_07150, partial [Prevotellaceae bacterium]|nr:hypothetical protein [Prevotellaceae bacterium]